MIVPLAALVGVSTALNAASDRSMGDTVEWPIIVVLAALVGPILGLAGLYIFANSYGGREGGLEDKLRPNISVPRSLGHRYQVSVHYHSGFQLLP